MSESKSRTVAALFQVAIVLIWVFLPFNLLEQIQRSRVSAASLGSVEESSEPSPTQREFVDWAKGRFLRAGLEFPDVEIRFHSHLSACDGHVGVFDGDTNRLLICQTNKKTILHELAHAWAHGNLTDRQRSQFTAIRGLVAWNDHTLEWSERATEHAAETIRWALMDRNTLVPGVTTVDGTDRQTWRLLSIGDSGPDQLHAAYRFLTGNRAVDRFADDPRLDLRADPISPEFYRTAGYLAVDRGVVSFPDQTPAHERISAGGLIVCESLYTDRPGGRSETPS